MDIQQLYQQAQKDLDNGHIQRAIPAYETVRQAALAEHNSWLAAECCHMIGVAYYQDRLYTEAEAALQDAEDEFKDLDETAFIGIVLRDRGLVAFKEEQYDQAKDLMQQSIDLLCTTDEADHLGFSKVKLGVVNSAQDQPEIAEQLVFAGIEDIQTSDNFFFLASANYDLAKVQRQLNQKVLALKSAQQAKNLIETHFPDDEYLSLRHQIAAFIRSINK
jgi:outer membrane protein assembly factor BamD (BamD/ComL family)